MIQVNLLPDLKKEYLKSRQVMHTVIVGAVLSVIVTVSLLGILFAYVQIAQPKSRRDLQVDIDAGVSKLKNSKDATKIVTVQGALSQITTLQNNKKITSRIFEQLLMFTPQDVAYNEVELDTDTNTLRLRGQTSTLENANILANNLKSAELTYKIGENESKSSPFSNILFDGLSKSDKPDANNKSVSFTISFQVDPVLFQQDVKDIRIKVNAGSQELILPTAVPFSSTPAPSAPTVPTQGVEQ